MDGLTKLFDTPAIRAWDKSTIDAGITSLDLMERAASHIADALLSSLEPDIRLLVIAGKGNNGGDAMAVTRLLREEGFASVTLCCVGGPSDERSLDAKANMERVEVDRFLNSTDDLPDLNEFDLLLDGLFGSGLSRPLEGFNEEIVQAFNHSNLPAWSIDMPSGAFADSLQGGPILASDLVISLQCPKRVFMFRESAAFMKQFIVLDIGLDVEFEMTRPCEWYYMDESPVLIPERNRFSHKGSFGHGLLIAGSQGMYGASVLAASAAMRAGIGKLTVHAPARAEGIIQSTVPEAMFSVDRAERNISTLPDLQGFDAIAVGPGLGMDGKTRSVLKELLENSQVPLVIDADALNIIAAENWQSLIPAGSILTPHPKEFERLFGHSVDSFDETERLREMARGLDSFIVLKGAYTRIATRDGRVIFNASGTPYMATAGMGDLLTGCILGALGQGLTWENAILHAVYRHGKAGEEAKESHDGFLTSRDLIPYL